MPHFPQLEELYGTCSQLKELSQFTYPDDGQRSFAPVCRHADELAYNTDRPPTRQLAGGVVKGMAIETVVSVCLNLPHTHRDLIHHRRPSDRT